MTTIRDERREKRVFAPHPSLFTLYKRGGKMRNIFYFILYLLSFILFIFSGCTYNFSGFMRSNIKSIYIPLFENQTIKYGIEEEITRSVIDAFIQDNKLKIKKKSDSILIGKILSYERKAFTYDENENVREYRIDIALNLIYKVRNGDVLWEKKLTEWTTYSSEETEENGIKDIANKIGDDTIRLVSGL
jgi:hypothetical protein